MIRGFFRLLLFCMFNRHASGQRWDTGNEALAARLSNWNIGQWQQEEREQWHWHFEGKHTPEQAQDFAECLRGRWVYMVGDSSTRLLFAAMVGLLEPSALDDKFMPQYQQSRCEVDHRECGLVLKGERSGERAHGLYPVQRISSTKTSVHHDSPDCRC